MKKWQFWLGVLISILFIWLALRGLRLDEFWDSVKQANYCLAYPRHRRLLHRRLGAGVEMALPA